AVQTLANTGGQPQAVVPLPDGALAVADAKKGLLAVDAQGAVRVLADSAEGLRFHFVNGVVADASGDNLYFTDSSWKFGPGHEIDDIIEHGANGRLLRYERRSG